MPDFFWDCSLVSNEGREKQSATIISDPGKCRISSIYSAIKKAVWLVEDYG